MTHVNPANRPARPRRRDVVENDDFAAFARRIIRAHGKRVATGDVEALRDRPSRHPRRLDQHGYVQGNCELAAEGVSTAEQALARIRECLTEVKAAFDTAVSRPMVGTSSTREELR
jgi:hypothetical protein